MLQVSKVLAQGAGLSPVLLKRANTVELDWDIRQKSRFDATDSAGRQLGIFLPRGNVVRGGDVLVAEDGSLVSVLAAPQSVLKITHCTQHGSPYDLIRAAYHLGNRHVPIELKPDHLKIEPDHVLADMLRAMHLIVHAVDEPFEPENGAYATGGHGHSGHGHSHTDHEHHAHGSTDAQANAVAHGHSAAPVSTPARSKLSAIPIAAAPTTTPAAPHVHGPGCGHSH